MFLNSEFEFYSLLAENMAVLHDVDPQVLNNLPSFSGDRPFIWDYIEQLFAFINKELPDVFKIPKVKQIYGSMEEIRGLVLELKENIDKFAAHPACSLALCHNDLLFTNIIYKKETGDLKIIDFEFGNSNYCSFDIGNIFDEFAGIEPIESIDYSRYPDHDYQIKWIKHYLKHRKSTVIVDSVNKVGLDQLAEQFYVVTQNMSLVNQIIFVYSIE